MAEWVYIVEALTDGDYGFPLDRIAEIGICRVDMDTKDVESMYGSRIRLEEGSFTAKQRDFLENRSGIKVSELQDAPDQFEVIDEVASILTGQTVTSFDIGMTVNRFLAFEPWGLTHEMTVMSSVGATVPEEFKGPEPDDERSAIRHAYDALYPNDTPAARDGETALDMAIRTAFIMLGIREIR
ncbi:MAG: hypothetical protein J6Y18_01525 [Candidatus Methanomethylophilaceae archaeon]|nr:hypothetical protein [Candidatus Methanomethylophilaceae archaeon]